jgi:hypothetical protein
MITSIDVALPKLSELKKRGVRPSDRGKNPGRSSSTREIDRPNERPADRSTVDDMVHSWGSFWAWRGGLETDLTAGPNKGPASQNPMQIVFRPYVNLLGPGPIATASRNLTVSDIPVSGTFYNFLVSLTQHPGARLPNPTSECFLVRPSIRVLHCSVQHLSVLFVRPSIRSADWFTQLTCIQEKKSQKNG